VLVDEYQDINKIQDAILGFVSTECLRDRRNAPASNLFSVGDVKQSIYGFRLAEPERFLERQRRFREAGQTLGTVIDLQANFRSRGPLLEVLNALFERLMVEEAADITYDASHHLRPGADYPAGTAEYFSGAPLELHLLPARPDFSEVEPADGDADSSDPSDLDRTDIEAAFIAGRIRQLLGADGRARMNVIEKLDGAMRPRPIEYRDIVILLRSLKFKADQFVDVLRRSGIPLHSSAGTGYFQSMEVRDMLALLNLLDNQRQDIPMAAVLRSPLSGIASTDDALARIHLAYRDADPPVPFHQAVVRYAAEQHDELAAALDDFLGHLRVWRELAHRRPLAEVIWTILDRTGYLAYCSGLPDGEQRCANLLHLHERARQFGTFQRQGLYRFMRFLDSLQAEHDVAQPSIAAESENVVRVMSIHGAKGLEFPVVFLPDLGKKFNFQSCQGPILFDRRAGLGLSAVDEERRIRYPSLASTVVQNRLKQQTLAEELRLLYVATTRAREHLILVGTCADSARETWTNRWTNHRGPLGVEDILGAGSMLDWIGPVSAAINSERERISITMHGAEEIARWPNPQSPLPKFSARQIALARLEPLADAPAENAAASAIIARLDHRYGFRDFAKLPASKAVTALTKSAAASVGIGERYSASALSSPLPAPKCVIGEIPSATDKGTATHLVLEYLDFAKPCDPGDVERQIESMVDRRLLTSAQAALVDRPCLEWFLNSSVGRLVCSNAGSLLRELPFYLAVPPGVVDPAIAGQPAPEDCVMIRGRIDLVVDQPAGLTIIDYKTDNVTAETIQLRAELYAAQMKLYREALTRITGRPVCAAHLIFLTPRMIV
jgi:ATP-dependent helicase/nuclease subunit A